MARCPSRFCETNKKTTRPVSYETATRYKERPKRATVLIAELRERGYAGGITMLKVFMASLKPAAVEAPVVRFQTAPGEQMQADWAVIRRGADRFVGVRGDARLEAGRPMSSSLPTSAWRR